jgi:Cd2+/Zn2+-exporting ATPase
VGGNTNILHKYVLEGLDCPNCAQKIESALNKELNTKGITVDFATKTVMLTGLQVLEAQQVIDRVEHGVKLVRERDLKEGIVTSRERRNSQKKLAIIGVSALLFALALVLEVRMSMRVLPVVLFAISYLLAGGKVILSAIKNIARGDLFEESFLMTVATLGAIGIGAMEEAIGVMLFFAVGEFLQDIAVNRSRRSIRELMDIRADYANLKINGDIRQVSASEVNIGDVIVVRPGEKVPLDGVIAEGESFMDTSALTGESVPKRARVGEPVLAGMINTTGAITVNVEKTLAESSVSKVLDLVENAAARKAPTERFITTFAKYYTPLVVIAAVLVALGPPLILHETSFDQWIYRALTLLVISCPCALVISIPLGYFGGIGSASRQGILVKGGSSLDTLVKLHTVVFDKTGTLTQGTFDVTQVVPLNGFTEEDVLHYASYAEAYSNHPIAQSILRRSNITIDKDLIEEYEEISGHGTRALVNGKRIYAGNDRLLHKETIEHERDICEVDGTVVYVAIDERLVGYLVISDELKADAACAIGELKSSGVKRIVMLTGDNEETASKVASTVGIEDYYANLLPIDKVEKIEQLESSLGDRDRNKLAFVGDGINDAPVITRADLGIAMGALGSDAAIEAADVVLMHDKPSKLVTAINVAKRTRKIVIQNIILALGIKIVFMTLGVLGIATMWEAVFADVGVALLAILNSTRTMLKMPYPRTIAVNAKPGSSCAV